jgi:ABC-2 type transport system ATP-binding protein
VIVAELDAVTKRYGGVTALDRLTLVLGAGDVVALLGPNGAGKTTAIAVLVGLRLPDVGTARLFGLDPRRPAARTGVGVVPQETAFPPTLRVLELLELVRRHYRRPANLGDLAERLRLGPLLRRQLGGLSGGERRLVAVALAFAGRPHLAVLDEPTTSLDAESRERVWETIRAHAHDGGSVLLSTHLLDEAEALAQRAVLLETGTVVADGSIAEIRRSAGLTRVSFRSGSGEVIRAAVEDAGAYVASLVHAGGRLAELEVRPLTLEEALAVRRERR